MADSAQDSPLTAALRIFDAAEANLVKLEKLWAKLQAGIPGGPQTVVFSDNPEYEDWCRSYETILKAMPKIDGWKPTALPHTLNEIAQIRADANDVGIVECFVAAEEEIDAPGQSLREYRFKLNQKRRELVRDHLVKLIDLIDEDLRLVQAENPFEEPTSRQVNGDAWDHLVHHVSEVETLIGSSIQRPSRWGDLNRHVRFGQLHDLYDIIKFDWPAAKADLRNSIFGPADPIPVEVDDLASVVRAKPGGPIATKLQWASLSAEDFERLIFSLISAEPGYQNPAWLMQTNAPDRGRDLSVERIVNDGLMGPRVSRVIIQCKHWLSKSVSLTELSLLHQQIPLWEPPRVDVCIIATSGRFTADCVAAIEKHNQSPSALRVEMWPDSHLENLLNFRPHLIAEFRLR